MYRKQQSPGGARNVRFGGESDSDDSEQEVPTYDHGVVEVDEDEEEQMKQFMSNNPLERRTLADIIQEKLTEKRTEIQSQMSGRFLNL